MTHLHDAQLARIRNQAKELTVPLHTFDSESKPQLIASAVPIKQNERRFLLTASHSCFDENGKLLHLFTKYLGTDQFKTMWLDGFRVCTEHGGLGVIDADLAVIVLSEQEAAALETTYQFTNVDEFESAEPRTVGRVISHYMMTGYLGKFNRSVSHFESATCVHLITSRYNKKVAVRKYKPGITKEDHFELQLARELKNDSGKKFKIGKPKAMSGGGIWRFESDQPNQKCSSPKLVGILIEAYIKKRTRQKVITASVIQNSIPLLNFA